MVFMHSATTVPIGKIRRREEGFPMPKTYPVYFRDRFVHETLPNVDKDIVIENRNRKIGSINHK